MTKRKVIEWSKESNQDKAIKIILFLVSPFLSAIYSVRRMNTHSSFIVFYLFAVFFGMAFTIDSGKTNDSQLDGSFYRQVFEDYHKTSYSSFKDGFKEYLSFNSAHKDYYFDILSFYLTRITDNYHWMFMISAMIFAFFALKCFRIFTNENKFDFSIASLILVYLFFVNSIFNINGLRFWTAAWIGVYCIFNIIKDKKWQYSLLLLLLPFIHVSFWLFIILFFSIILLKKFEKIWIILFIISFFVGNLSIELLQSYSNYAPPFIERVILSYTDKSMISSISQGTGFFWVERLMGLLVRVFINLMVFLFIKNREIIKANYSTKNLYLFLIQYMTFVNFSLAVPSLGARFQLIAFPIIAYIWLVNFKDVKYQRFLYLTPIIFWFNIRTELIYYFKILDFTFYFTNPFSLIYFYLIS